MHEVPQGRWDKKFDKLARRARRRDRQGRGRRGSDRSRHRRRSRRRMWGGWVDRARRSLARDTITNVWSCTKTVTALAALILSTAGRWISCAGRAVLAGVPQTARGSGPATDVAHFGCSGWENPFRWRTFGTRRRPAGWATRRRGGSRVQHPDITPQLRPPDRRGRQAWERQDSEEFMPRRSPVRSGPTCRSARVESDWGRIAPVVPPRPLDIDLAALDPRQPDVQDVHRGPGRPRPTPRTRQAGGAPTWGRSTATATRVPSRGCCRRWRSAARSTG